MHFCSCSTQNKTSYALLVAELHKRFTPVHFYAVQNSLFHDQKQKSGEPVGVCTGLAYFVS